MHKLVKIIATFAVLTLFFGVTLTTHAVEPTTNQIIVGGAIKVLSGGIIPSSVAIPLAQVGSGDSPGIGSIIGAAKDVVVDAATGAGGQFLSWVGLKLIGYVMFVLSYIAGFIASTVFTLAGLFVTFGLYLNTTILDGEVVQIGWRFCRDLANLGFTIGIVVIAYATMLGIESYGMKKLIQNFIVAAVMVNFSFSIAGFAIDISNMLTHFFVNASIGGGAGEVGWDSIQKFTETLASAFNPQKLLVTDPTNIKAYESLSSNDGMIAAVLSIFFVALFTAFAALGMLMVGLTTISRFVYLSALIIVMPLAVLCYAFPNTKSYYGQWYKAFMCQLTYLPAATFSMYIVIMFVQVKSNINYGSTQAVDIWDLVNTFEAAEKTGGLTSTRTLQLMAAPFQTITNMVLVLAMLFYGITKSRTIGCAGGDIALKWMNGLKNWAVGTATGAPAWAGRKYLSGGIQPEENKENRGKRLANWLSSKLLLRRLVPTLNNFTAGTSKNVGNFETEYKGLGDIQLLNNLRSVEIRTNAERMAAAAKVAAERGLFSETDPEKGLTQKEFEAFIPAAKRYGLDKDILKKMPHLYGKFGLNVEKDGNGDYVNKEDGKKFDDIMKAFKAEEVENLPIEAFNDIEVVQRLSGAQLEKLPKGKEHRAAFTSTILRLREKIGSTEFDKYMGKTFSKAEASDALTPELLANKDIVRNLTNGHLKRISSPDKKKQRDEFLRTINSKDPVTGEYIFTEKDLNDFARKNFSRDKDISEIHPDILRNQRIFGKFQGMHVGQLQKEPDTEQQRAVLETLRDEYLNAFADPATLARLDTLAAPIVENKTNSSWAIVGMPEGKDAFRVIETDYRSRHPDEEKPQKKKQQAEKTEKQETKTKERGWWEDDDKGSNPPSGGPQQPPQNPPSPASPAGGSATAETYKLAPERPTAPAPQVAPKAAEIKPANKPQRTAPEEAESRNGKGPDIGETIDEMFKKAGRQEKPAETETAKTPQVAATNPQSTVKPAGTPVTSPELDTLVTQEEERLKKAEGRGWQPPEPIDAEFEPKPAPATEPLKRITDKGPLVPPEQKPASVPEPIKTLIERERDANENQLSVIPKFQPANQPKRITYEGPVTPPPAPTLPEPIRTLREEEDRRNNQLIRLPKDESGQSRGSNGI